jgi:hypothetical protein
LDHFRLLLFILQSLAWQMSRGELCSVFLSGEAASMDAFTTFLKTHGHEVCAELLEGSSVSRCLSMLAVWRSQHCLRRAAQRQACAAVLQQPLRGQGAHAGLSRTVERRAERQLVEGTHWTLFVSLYLSCSDALARCNMALRALSPLTTQPAPFPIIVRLT